MSFGESLPTCLLLYRVASNLKKKKKNPTFLSDDYDDELKSNLAGATSPLIAIPVLNLARSVIPRCEKKVGCKPSEGCLRGGNTEHDLSKLPNKYCET